MTHNLSFMLMHGFVILRNDKTYSDFFNTFTNSIPNNGEEEKKCLPFPATFPNLQMQPVTNGLFHKRKQHTKHTIQIKTLAFTSHSTH